MIRLINSTRYPLTTAPALILSSGKLVSQAMMTYTASGADTDLRLTTAVNIKVKKTDTETSRTPDAATIDRVHLSLVELKGVISITNYDTTPAYIEVTRNVMGTVGKADHEGTAEMVNVFEDDGITQRESLSPLWVGWYTWPYWWYRFNGIGRITWKLTLQPSQSIDLNYNWRYYWE
jgi:hypothetical protein